MSIKPGTGWLTLASLLFTLFIANILLGKAALAPNFETPLKLSDVGEFLLLFATFWKPAPRHTRGNVFSRLPESNPLPTTGYWPNCSRLDAPCFLVRPRARRGLTPSKPT